MAEAVIETLLNSKCFGPQKARPIVHLYDPKVGQKRSDIEISIMGLSSERLQQLKKTVEHVQHRAAQLKYEAAEPSSEKRITRYLPEAEK